MSGWERLKLLFSGSDPKIAARLKTVDEAVKTIEESHAIAKRMARIIEMQPEVDPVLPAQEELHDQTSQ